MNWLKIGMFGLAFVTLIGLIYAIEPDKIIDAMSEIEFSLLILAVILYSINTVIKAMRWRLIVSSTGYSPFILYPKYGPGQVMCFCV